MDKLRITGGALKGRRVQVTHGDFEIRPAMDKMRQSLFSILGQLDGFSFLDLFSGSGIMALEAASRGADNIVCVERDKAKFSNLLTNVAMSPVRIQCHALPVERFIQRCKTTFDIIFCDPPFPYAHKSELIHSIAEQNILSDEGIVIIHYPSKEILQTTDTNLEMYDERLYGRSLVRFYKKTAPSAS